MANLNTTNDQLQIIKSQIANLLIINVPMTARQSRLDLIRQIIQLQEIGNQEELSQALRKAGHNLTQSSLSRDLKLLKVVKGFAKSGKNIYMLPDSPKYIRVRKHRDTGQAILNGFMSVRISGQLAVIKCRPGYASGLASDIDNANFPEIIGTLAGDDTIFLALEEDFDKEVLENDLRSIAPVYQGSQFDEEEQQ